MPADSDGPGGAVLLGVAPSQGLGPPLACKDAPSRPPPPQTARMDAHVLLCERDGEERALTLTMLKECGYTGTFLEGGLLDERQPRVCLGLPLVSPRPPFSPPGLPPQSPWPAPSRVRSTCLRGRPAESMSC